MMSRLTLLLKVKYWHLTQDTFEVSHSAIIFSSHWGIESFSLSKFKKYIIYCELFILYLKPPASNKSCVIGWVWTCSTPTDIYNIWLFLKADRAASQTLEVVHWDETSQSRCGQMLLLYFPSTHFLSKSHKILLHLLLTSLRWIICITLCI